VSLQTGSRREALAVLLALAAIAALHSQSQIDFATLTAGFQDLKAWAPAAFVADYAINAGEALGVRRNERPC
jgi:hypothetical protein